MQPEIYGVSKKSFDIKRFLSRAFGNTCFPKGDKSYLKNVGTLLNTFCNTAQAFNRSFQQEVLTKDSFETQEQKKWNIIKLLSKWHLILMAYFSLNI